MNESESLIRFHLLACADLIRIQREECEKIIELAKKKGVTLNTLGELTSAIDAAVEAIRRVVDATWPDAHSAADHVARLASAFSATPKPQPKDEIVAKLEAARRFKVGPSTSSVGDVLSGNVIGRRDRRTK